MYVCISNSLESWNLGQVIETAAPAPNLALTLFINDPVSGSRTTQVCPSNVFKGMREFGPMRPNDISPPPPGFCQNTSTGTLRSLLNSIFMFML